MATVILGAVGAAIGGSVITGTVLGLTGAAIGAAVGQFAGSLIDSAIAASLAPTQRVEGPRQSTFGITSAAEGASMPMVLGTFRTGGVVIWATNPVEVATTTTTRVGGKGARRGQRVQTTEFRYFASWAIAICEGPISGIGRVWRDGHLFDLSTVTVRTYLGTEDQPVDPLIDARTPGGAPAYRGTAYMVFENVDVTDYGGRIPQLSFEVTRLVSDATGPDARITSVALLTGRGEQALHTAEQRETVAGAARALNVTAQTGTADAVVALDQIETALPAVNDLVIPVSWVMPSASPAATDLRPGVERAERVTEPATWTAGGFSRAQARALFTDAAGLAPLRGTPSDASVVALAAEAEARGLAVTLRPEVAVEVVTAGQLVDSLAVHADDAEVAGQTLLTFRNSPGQRCQMYRGSPGAWTLIRTVTSGLSNSPHGAVSPSGDRVAIATATGIDVYQWTGTDFTLISSATNSTFRGEIAWLNETLFAVAGGVPSGRARVDIYNAAGVTLVASVNAPVANQSVCQGLAATANRIVALFASSGGGGAQLAIIEQSPDWAVVQAVTLSGYGWSVVARGRIALNETRVALVDATSLRVYGADGTLIDEKLTAFYASPSVHFHGDLIVTHAAGAVFRLYSGATAGGVADLGTFAGAPGRLFYGAGLLLSSRAAVPVIAFYTLGQQAAYPSRRSIVPATAGDVTAFFGAATPASFTRSGTTVTYTGSPSDTGYRRFVLHYAHLAAGIGTVDTFLIGAGLRGITRAKIAGAYPGVTALVALAADVRAILGAGVKIGYAAAWDEYGAAGTAADLEFPLDPLWASGNIDFVGIDHFIPLSDWRDGAGHLDAAVTDDPTDFAYLWGRVEGGEGHDWAYATPAARDAQTRTTITEPFLRPKDLAHWWGTLHRPRVGGVEGAATGWVAEGKPIRLTIGCAAVDKGTNATAAGAELLPRVEVPPYSTGARADGVQRAALEVLGSYWAVPDATLTAALADRLGADPGDTRNPVSAVYAGRMVERVTAWGWDARPYPAFPARADLWADGIYWGAGHWMQGRGTGATLAGMVRAICARAGLTGDLIDVSRLSGAVRGYVLPGVESARDSLAQLMRYGAFDGVESGGRIVFAGRGGPTVASLAFEGLAAEGEGEPFTLTRAQASELPGAVRFTLYRSDEDGQTFTVEATWRGAAPERTQIAQFNIADDPAVADAVVRRDLAVAYAARDKLALALPPSLLAVDPGDVIAFTHAGRTVTYRVVSVADAGARRIEAVATDADLYRLAPGPALPANPTIPPVFGPPVLQFLDLPRLSVAVDPGAAFVAVRAAPWYGTAAIFRSPTAEGFELVGTAEAPARIGDLAAALPAGVAGRWDRASVVDVRIDGTFSAADDLAVLGGGNRIAVQGTGGWEVLGFAEATLVETGRWRLSRLLRGQAGTEGFRGAVQGARVVVLDGAVAALPVATADVGVSANWRIGPASRDVADTAYAQVTYAPAGRGLECLSPARVLQDWRRPRTVGDLVIRWQRRDRDPGANNWTLIDAPMTEATEAYEVEVLNGATVLRTLTAGAPTVTYTAAQQTADWGAALPIGGTLSLRIYQMSALVGRGDPLITTVRI